jgi:hypothetical protein
MTAAELRVIIRRTLQQVSSPDCAFWSPAAENWCLGTAAQESHLGKWRRQMGHGPARGIYQMEPATHDWLWSRLHRPERRDLRQKITELLVAGVNPLDQLESNDPYATAMARLRIWVTSARWPVDPLDLPALAHIWKVCYNSVLGVGKEVEWLANWRLLIGGVS